MLEGEVVATLGQGRFSRSDRKISAISHAPGLSVYEPQMEDISVNFSCSYLFLLQSFPPCLVACKEYDRSKAISQGYVTRILQEKAILQSLSVSEFAFGLPEALCTESIYCEVSRHL
jgi:hypothetical protein